MVAAKTENRSAVKINTAPENGPEHGKDSGKCED